MAKFKISVKRTFAFEGGHFNSQYDSGGSTMYGITEADAREYGYTGKMENFKYEDALNIYEKKY